MAGTRRNGLLRSEQLPQRPPSLVIPDLRERGASKRALRAGSGSDPAGPGRSLWEAVAQTGFPGTGGDADA